MAYTLEEQLEELQKSIDTHEEVLSSIVWALVDEENLSLDAKDSIRDAFKLIYGRDKK
jgi:predicted nucleic-acid-binding protein